MKHKSYIFIIISACLFGSVGAFNKAIFLSGVVQNFYRFLFATIILTILIYFSKNIKFAVKRQDIKLIIINGIASAITAIAVTEAILRINIGQTVVIMYFAPILIAIFGPIWFKQDRIKNTLIYIFSSIIGLTLLNYPLNLKADGLGILLAFVSTVSFATIILSSKLLSQNYNPFTLSFWRSIISLGIIFPFFAIFHDYNINLNQFFLIFILAIITSIIGLTIFYKGIKEANPLIASLLLYLEPVSSLIYGIIFFGESYNFFNYAGLVIVLLVSIILVIQTEKKQNPSPKKIK